MPVGPDLDLDEFGERVAALFCDSSWLDALRFFLDCDLKFAPWEEGIDEFGWEYTLPNRLYLFADQPFIQAVNANELKWTQLKQTIEAALGEVKADICPTFRPGKSLHQPWKDEAARLIALR